MIQLFLSGKLRVRDEDALPATRPGEGPHPTANLGAPDASDRDVAEVCWSSTDDTLSQEQTLWEFWHALARCGIYVDRLYRHSEVSVQHKPHLCSRENLPQMVGSIFQQIQIVMAAFIDPHDLSVRKIYI